MKFLPSLIIVIIILFLGYGLADMRSKRHEFEDELVRLQEKARNIVDENQNIQAQVDYYSNTENLENHVRAVLNMKKPGEKLVIVTSMDNRGEQDGKLSAQAHDIVPESFFQKLFNILSF